MTRYEENREMLKQRALEYYYKKRAERLEYGKQYGLEKRKEIREYYKKWYEKNRDTCLEKRRAAYHGRPKPPRPSKPEKPAKPPKTPKPPKPEKPAKPPKPIKPPKPAKYIYIPPEPVQRYVDASFELSFA